MQETRIRNDEAQRLRERLLAYSPFRSLSRRELDNLIGATVRLETRAGELLFSEGQSAHYCGVVDSGQIAGVRYTENGDEKFFCTHGPGRLVALTAAFLNGSGYIMSYRATLRSRVFGVPARQLRALAEANGPFASRLLEQTSERLQSSFNQVDFFTASSAEQRVAAFLLQLHEEQESREIRLPCRQKQVALMLGVREETVSRVLNDFRREGILAPERSPIGLRDLDFLERLVGEQYGGLRFGAL
ncbi:MULTISPECIES: Crp/Fnr family transcriptional regulator [Halomonadaceae]|uniref:Helix-turn-helix domain-containing protein n=1 Tax=Vreelandella halophila TaxID=86177 RepID=A0A9X4YDQ2_9GAMM|nr:MULTISPECIES: Crp/Fnr family transcriptional regulator [Halomonas]MYL26075.1 helix-turn-helix domain-containing protein [Halomonas utahensis]MYL73363.1 helix-turn-helix domain-containing protein [Halomonas sp. 22501_18_FS]